MYLHVSVTSLITSFQNAQRYAEAHDMGNEAAMFTKLIRDLDTIKTMPPEAFAGFWSDSQMAPPAGARVAPQPPGPPETRVNTTSTMRNAQGPAQWPGNKPLSPPEPGDETPPPKPFIQPDLPAGVTRNATVDKLGRDDLYVRGATGDTGNQSNEKTPGPLKSDAERGWPGASGATGPGSAGATGSTGATGAIDGIGF